MPQNQETGAAGNDFGHKYGPKIGRALGAEQIRKGANEFLLDGQRICIKCAQSHTSGVGVTRAMIERVARIFGAFQHPESETFDLYELDAPQYRRRMTASQSRSHAGNRVFKFSKSVFKTKGRFFRTVKVA